MALDGGQQDNGGLFLPNGKQYMTQQLTTIPAAPEAAPEAAPGPEGTAPPAQGTPEAASAVAPKTPDRDMNLELSKKFESVAQKEGRARKAEREAQAKLQGLTEREAKLAAREAELEEALGDPVGYMLKNGKDPVEVAKRYAQPETPEEKRIRKLEERDAEREAAATKAREEAEEREATQKMTGAMRAFVGEITARECPNLTTLYQAKEVPDLVRNLLTRPEDPDDPDSDTMLEAFKRTHGRAPRNVEIREVLEYEAELRATKIIEADRARAASAATSPGTNTQTSSKSESGPSGISNKHAAGTSTTSVKKLTLEERRKKTKRELTAALEAEAPGDD